MKQFLSRRLGEMSCWEIDMTLALNFDWQELSNAIVAAEGPVCKASCCTLSDEDFTIALAHQLAHQSKDFQKRVHVLLDRQHRWAIKEVRTTPAKQIGRYLDSPPTLRDLPGIAWALISDERTEVVRCGVCLLRRALFRHFPAAKSA